MQIDLANTLVRKVYFVLSCIILHCSQARSPLLRRGWGRLPLKWGGHTDKQVNHKMDFDFEFD